MKIARTLVLHSAFHLGIVALLGYLIFGFPSLAPATVELDGAKYRVTGPYTCENMSVFLIHADDQDPRRFITRRLLSAGRNGGHHSASSATANGQDP